MRKKRVEGSRGIKMTITRPNNKSFTAYFSTKKDLTNFQDFIETIIENAQKEVMKNEKVSFD